jgi:hypothetical protein
MSPYILCCASGRSKGRRKVQLLGQVKYQVGCSNFQSPGGCRSGQERPLFSMGEARGFESSSGDSFVKSPILSNFRPGWSRRDFRSLTTLEDSYLSRVLGTGRAFCDLAFFTIFLSRSGSSNFFNLQNHDEDTIHSTKMKYHTRQSESS